ncbi:thermonuclease family protein [Aquamicrobium sp. LC103]|uniref:thermonuclease family protein n=1 Tax=Aquamicrobium sp. LC103 TaxID=1120658 RepID=UPI00063E8E86|nr:thermonuclease family protein [Aquamicrobium sp. LC103]TKT79161.1 thermonuclease family protein [Aquamicrobium sp. LC103]
MRTYRPRRAARNRRSSRPRSRLRKVLDIALTVVLLGAVALVAARFQDDATQTLGGNAIVNDGDTITLGEQKIRLRGIDAPEFTQQCTRNGAAYDCGREARNALRRMVAGGRVSCEGWENDKYDRLLAVCHAGGVNLNKTMVERGWAVSYGDFYSEEDVARRAGEGMWAGSFDRPQYWRRVHGGLAETGHGGGGLSGFFNWLLELFSSMNGQQGESG